MRIQSFHPNTGVYDVSIFDESSNGTFIKTPSSGVYEPIGRRRWTALPNGTFIAWGIAAVNYYRDLMLYSNTAAVAELGTERLRKDFLMTDCRIGK